MSLVSRRVEFHTFWPDRLFNGFLKSSDGPKISERGRWRSKEFSTDASNRCILLPAFGLSLADHEKPHDPANEDVRFIDRGVSPSIISTRAAMRFGPLARSSVSRDDASY